MRGGNVFRILGGVWMRAGGASNIGGGKWEIVVDNGKNDGGGTEEKTAIEREDITGENGEGGLEEEE